MPPAHYPGANGGIPQTPRANISDFMHIIRETYRRKVSAIEPTELLLDVPLDSELRQVRPVKQMISNAWDTMHHLVFVSKMDKTTCERRREMRRGTKDRKNIENVAEAAERNGRESENMNLRRH